MLTFQYSMYCYSNDISYLPRPGDYIYFIDQTFLCETPLCSELCDHYLDVASSILIAYPFILGLQHFFFLLNYKHFRAHCILILYTSILFSTYLLFYSPFRFLQLSYQSTHIPLLNLLQFLEVSLQKS